MAMLRWAAKISAQTFFVEKTLMGTFKPPYPYNPQGQLNFLFREASFEGLFGNHGGVGISQSSHQPPLQSVPNNLACRVKYLEGIEGPTTVGLKH